MKSTATILHRDRLDRHRLTEADRRRLAEHCRDLAELKPPPLRPLRGR